MDWEKQDNELRRLMEGHAFLPDRENWNATAAWKKLQQKQNTAAKRTVPVWIRLSVAACMAGLLGLAIWNLLPTGFAPNPAKTMAGKGNAVRNHESNQPVSGEIARTSRLPEATANVQQSLPPAEAGNSLVETRRQDEGRIAPGQSRNGEGLRETITTVPADTFITGPTVAAVAATPAIIADPAENTAGNISSTGGEAVAAPGEKPKTRVVHFNQLGSTQPAVVPVYAQTKKLFFEPGSLLVQSSQKPAEQLFQLKIDISPAPKKSL